MLWFSGVGVGVERSFVPGFAGSFWALYIYSILIAVRNPEGMPSGVRSARYLSTHHAALRHGGHATAVLTCPLTASL